jgi:hypothetical protein
MPIYIATIYPTDPDGLPMLPVVTRDEADSEEAFKTLVRDWWISRYGVDSEPDFGPIGLSKDQS